MEKDWKGKRDYFQIYDFFQLNSKRYVEMLNWHLNELKGFNNILETGCGTGNLSVELLNRNHNVSGIDITPSAIKIAKEKCSNYSKKCNFIEGNVENLISYYSKNEFDAISSMIVLPFPNPEKYLSNSYNVLKPGGKFVITSWAYVLDIEYGAIGLLEKELEEKGILQGYEKKLDIIKNDIYSMTQNILKKKLTLPYLIDILSNLNFKDIQEHESPYGKYAYSLTCKR